MTALALFTEKLIILGATDRLSSMFSVKRDNPDRRFDSFFSLFDVFVRCQFLITYCAGGKRDWISSIAFFTVHMRHWIRVRRHENNTYSSYMNISNMVPYSDFKKSMRIQQF